MWSCSSGITDYPKTVLKLEEKYRNKGYEILESSGEYSDESNHYLLLRKDNVVFLDRVIKGEAMQTIYPSEKGVSFKTAEIYFDKGIKIKNKNLDSNPEYLSAEFQSWRKTHNILCFRSKYNDDFSIIYHIGRNEALVLYGEPVSFTSEYFCQVQHFTFADLYGEDYFDVFISPSDYSFSIEKRISYDDLSVSGFSDVRIEKEKFPWMILQRKLGGKAAYIEESGSSIYIPVSWLGTPQMDIVADCIEDAWYEEEERVWQAEQEAAQQHEQEEMIKYIEENAIDFNDMWQDYNNPIKAEKKYTIGEDILLKIRIDKIEYSYSGYTYVLSWLGSFTTDVYVYTNDNNFAELDYPQIVWIKAKYSSRYEAWDNTVTYKFTDAQLLLWKKPGLFE